MTVPRPAVFDTSIFVGRESRGVGALNDWAPIVSIVTIAELQLGVAAARSPEIRDRRTETHAGALRAVVVGIALDEAYDVVSAWVTLRRALQRKMPANDSWIAATALALGVPVITQDDDYEAAGSIIEVVKI